MDGKEKKKQPKSAFSRRPASVPANLTEPGSALQVSEVHATRKKNEGKNFAIRRKKLKFDPKSH